MFVVTTEGVFKTIEDAESAFDNMGSPIFNIYYYKNISIEKNGIVRTMPVGKILNTHVIKFIEDDNEALKLYPEVLL